MPLITDIVGTLSEMGTTTKVEDTLRLTSEERASAHMAAVTESGQKVKISLPRGSELNDGDVLAVDEETMIVVRAADERLYVIAPGAALQWGIAAFHLGNLHRPVRFSDDAMLTPADPKVADVLRSSGISFHTCDAPFVGVRYGSYTGHDHHEHAHENGHSHDHSH